MLNVILFTEADSSKRRSLKKNAIPSQKLPLQIENANQSSSGSSRTERLAKRQENIAVSETNLEFCQSEEIENTQQSTEEVALQPQQLPLLPTTELPPKTFQDFEVQVNTPKIVTLCDIFATDMALNSFTGLSTAEMLDTLVEAVQLIYSDQRSHRLTIKERIVLLLTKLKCDMTYATLSVLFGISHELCKKYIFEMLPILSRVLSSTIIFPDSMEIKRNLPKCFECFENVRVVIDCTEIPIQKAKCLCCRIRFYSQYKSNTTVKFMTGVSPGGIITFISEPYGGRASDKIIFEKSNLILKLKSSSDAIMVDKGFLIDDICERFKIELIRPPFLQHQKQLTTEQALVNSKIAAARVHIERVNQRIKVFKILSNKLHWSLVDKVKEIFIIACGITNLSQPILADIRFLND